ncbi:hypothetical protein FRB97_008494 [Tulasnella sp. 331]|nr:hypothetical protein FRB97_008494 [Tulasnella sp. 331]KAG8874485.1 hypothetical protein FRB98_008396 [Tulasnella sp. 332]
MSASVTTKNRFLDLIRKPSTIYGGRDASGSNPSVPLSTQPDVVLHERESRGLKLVSDMRARTKALQAKIGAVNLPRVSHVENFAVSTSKFGARARQSLGSSIKPKKSRVDVHAKVESSERQSIDARSSLDTDVTSFSARGRTSTDTAASTGWDSLSDVVVAASANITPRAQRGRTRNVHGQHNDTIRPMRKILPRPSVEKMAFNPSPVPDSQLGRARQAFNVSTQPMYQASPSPFSLSSIDSPAPAIRSATSTSHPSFVRLEASRTPLIPQPTPDSTPPATITSSQAKSKGKEKSGVGIGVLKHKRSITLDRLGEGWTNGWKPPNFGIGSRKARTSAGEVLSRETLPPTIAASVSTSVGDSVSEILQHSSIPQPSTKLSERYSGLPASGIIPPNTMVASRIARKGSRAGRDDADGGVVVKGGGISELTSVDPNSPCKIPQRKTSRASGVGLAL